MPRAIPEQRLLPVPQLSPLEPPTLTSKTNREGELSIPVDQEFLHRH